MWDWNLPSNRVKAWDFLPHFCFAVIVPVIHIEFTVTGLLPEQCLNNIVETTILLNIVSTTLFNNDGVTRFFVVVGNRKNMYWSEQPGSPIVNKWLQKWLNNFVTTLLYHFWTTMLKTVFMLARPTLFKPVKVPIRSVEILHICNL